MSKKNPLDQLESMLTERQRKRPFYLKVLLDSVPYIKSKASEWFTYEVDVAQREMELLEHIMPETTVEWEVDLRRIKAKFKKASQSLDKIAEKVKQGKVTSIGEIYEREPKEHDIIPIPPSSNEKQEGEELDLASSFLGIMDAAEKLEELIHTIEREANRTLILRKLVKIELKSK